MKSIYKYELTHEVSEVNKFAVPGMGVILHVGTDPRNVPCMWIAVDTEKPDVNIEVLMIGTGWSLDFMEEDPRDWYFVGTIKEGIYMWHIFFANALDRSDE